MDVFTEKSEGTNKLCYTTLGIFINLQNHMHIHIILKTCFNMIYNIFYFSHIKENSLIFFSFSFFGESNSLS